jgi:RimJ/RimL family protein N-acetyltransferase
MEIRPLVPADLDQLDEIDATIESTDYLHLELAGEGVSCRWSLEPRRLRQRLVQSNRLRDELRFDYKQSATGVNEGIALVAEHEGRVVAASLALPSPEHGTMRLVDLRVDSDFRRQGIASVMIFQIIAAARERNLRAVHAETLTNNHPANQLLVKLAFELSGVDTRRHTNHDMVKETATLLWYAALD